jgi:hypothetical protein
VNEDPFGVLGLPRRPGLSDDDVRAAWRRIAAATHPDRDDGGDPAVYGAAAAAYATLRTAYGRGEALADLAAAAPGPGTGGRAIRDRLRAHGRHSAHRGRGTWGLVYVKGRDGAREVRGRPWMLALRAVAATAVGALALAVAGLAPATIGVLAGSVTWLIATGRHDLP